MSSLLLMACLAISDVEVKSGTIEEMVDVIELHHGYDFRGRLAFRQLIFYRWSSYHRRFQVVDTVVVTADSMCPKQTRSGIYQCRWKEVNGTRIVTGLTFRESRSKTDPEVAERDYLPTNLRQGLKKTAFPHSVNRNPFIRTSGLPPRPQVLKKF